MFEMNDVFFFCTPDCAVDMAEGCSTVFDVDLGDDVAGERGAFKVNVPNKRSGFNGQNHCEEVY